MPSRKSNRAIQLAPKLPLTAAAPYPGFVEPARPNLQKKAPSGDRWIHEIKWDGYRIQLHKVAGQVRLYTRNGYDWTPRFPGIVEAARQLRTESAILDGEIIFPNHAGGDFNAMQNSMTGPRRAGHQFQLFDILYLNGADLRERPLIKRKTALDNLLVGAPDVLRFVEWIEEADGVQVYQSACELGLEGIVSKLLDAPYRSGDSTDWIKVKCVKRAKYVVVGYVPQVGGSVAALRLARREGTALVYAGKVGSGFSAKSGAEVRAKLEPLMRKAAALSKPLKKPGTVWVEPRYEADVEYLEETAEGLRHPSFKGMAGL